LCIYKSSSPSLLVSRFNSAGCSKQEEGVSLEGHVVPKKDTFSYLGTMGTYHHIDEDVIHKVKTGLSA